MQVMTNACDQWGTICGHKWGEILGTESAVSPIIGNRHVQLNLEQAMKAQRGSKYIVLLFL
jgi:hypothetical protein